MATQLNSVNSVLLPPEITGPIFAKVTEQSAVQSLARRVPMSVTANTAVPVPLDVPMADWVAEGGVKPVSQVGTGVKQMTGKKVALLVPVSQEVVMTNPAGVYDQLEQDLPTAIARAFDYAAINGKSLRTGGAGPWTEYLSGVAQSTTTLGTATQANGGIYGDLLSGVGQVVDKNFDFTGFAADPRLKVTAQKQTDTTGQLQQPVATSRNLLDYPTFYNKGVSGKYWRAGNSVQTINIVGTPTGGSSVWSIGGNNITVAFNAAGSTVQTAIQALGGIFAAVTVTGTAPGPYTLTFPAVGSVQTASAPVSVNQTGLTGGTAATSKATVVAGGQGAIDSTLRAIGGDWSQAAYGVGMDISVRVSTEASYYDGATWHSAFQENLQLLLVEAYYGFVVGDGNAFVAYVKGSTL